MYEAGFAVFVLGSLLCALAWSEPSMVGFRVLQGIGGALIAANSGAVIADTCPANRRGRAYGINAVGWNLGAIIGIVLGGSITTYWSWRWIFWINVPIGLLALFVALRALRDRSERQPQKLDLGGWACWGSDFSESSGP
jgi:MFS family permease